MAYQNSEFGFTTRVANATLLLVAAWVLSAVAGQSASAQAYKVIHEFSGNNGQSPFASVLEVGGVLYSTTVDGGPNAQGTVFKLRGTAEVVLYGFTGGSDGGNPLGGLISDSKGNFYGTTPIGGAFGSGTVFKVNSSKNVTVLYNFAGGADGDQPQCGLVRDAAGNLYGTTVLGGKSGNGTVFKVATNGKETVLHSFNGTDGQYPYAGLLRDSAGNLYGTTGGDDAKTWGTVFKLDNRGVETVLYHFKGGADGALPTGALIQDSAGNLYGTTLDGGSGNGVVFKVSPRGAETVLHKFTGGVDGAHPLGSLVQDANGNLYGTTNLGGKLNLGTVFEVEGVGKETVLHSFAGGKQDGAYPQAGLVRDSQSNLFGTASFGGATNDGILFELSP
jgi:uncharacterized repeat protein (TIGR03803 family)